MKRLFADDKYEQHNEIAQELSDEVAQAIRPIVKKYHEMGYSMRYIEYVLHSEVTTEYLGMLLLDINDNNDKN